MAVDNDWDSEYGECDGGFAIKQCPQCQVFVDAAKILCECGYDFEEVHLPKEVVQFLEKKGYHTVEVRIVVPPTDDDEMYFGYISKEKKGTEAAFTAAKVEESWWVEIFTKSTTHEIKKEM